MRYFLLILCGLIPVGNRAATYVSGPILSNTTWTVTNSPYIIAGNISVDSGITLTIQPGVQVKANGNYTLFIDGKLMAVGTPTDSITFTSNQVIPKTGDWGGISFRKKSSPDTSQIGYCYIEYAGVGINVNYANPVIFNTVIRKNNTGINTTQGNYITVKNCLITQNTNYGVSLNIPGQIIGCEISNNNNGIYCYLGTTTCLIKNNMINYNQTGMLGNGSCVFTITGNTLIGNSVVGITISSTSTVNSIIDSNLFMYNVKGASLNDIKGVFTHNTVAYNLTGVEHGWSTFSNQSFSLKYNCIYNNSYYNFKETGQMTQPNDSVSNNWWGTTNTVSIDSAIYDYYDDVLLTKAFYNPVLTQPDNSCQPTTPSPLCSQPTFVTVTPTSVSSASAVWSVIPGAIGYEYVWDNFPITLPLSGAPTTNTSVNIKNLQAVHNYDFCVRTKCPSSPYYSGWSCSKFSIPCLEPGALHINFVWLDNITISWDTAAGVKSYEYYITPISSPNPTSTSITNGATAFLNGLSPNTVYIVCVRSICNSDYSSWTCDTVTTLTSGITDLNNTHIHIYPNPVKSSFTIESVVNISDANVTVTDMFGKLIHQSVFSGNKYSVNMSTLPPGLYFVKCATESGTQTIKIIKE